MFVLPVLALHALFSLYALAVIQFYRSYTASVT